MANPLNPEGKVKTPPIGDVDKLIMTPIHERRAQHPDEMEHVVKFMARELVDYQCVQFDGLARLNLSPDANFGSYRAIMKRLAKESASLQRYGTLIRFWVGDLLVQGENIFGEEYAAVLGVELSGREWDEYTIKNLMWVCKSLRPEHRRLDLSWQMHKELAPAWVEDEDREYYIKKASDVAADNPHYVRDVVSSMNQKYIRDFIAEYTQTEKFADRWKGMIEENPAFWYDYAEKNPHVPFPRFKSYITKKKPLQPGRRFLPKWVTEYTLANSPSDESTAFCMQMVSALRNAIDNGEVTMKEWNEATR